MTPAIDLEAVEFSWQGQERLLHVERFTVDRGERVFLKAPSGSGKSTLLGLVGGVLTPRSGIVSVIGTRLNSLDASGRDRFRGEHLGLGLLGMLTAILTSLNERRREMAVLRSVGARPRHVFGLLVAEAGLVAALGITAGGIGTKFFTNKTS